jgi:hypothetical protein
LTYIKNEDVEGSNGKGSGTSNSRVEQESKEMSLIPFSDTTPNEEAVVTATQDALPTLKIIKII